MIQHLGLGEDNARGVYSLYLKDWYPANRRLEIEFFSFEGIESNKAEGYERLQILEDIMWEINNPVLVKRAQIQFNETYEKPNSY